MQLAADEDPRLCVYGCSPKLGIAVGSSQFSCIAAAARLSHPPPQLPPHSHATSCSVEMSSLYLPPDLMHAR